MSAEEPQEIVDLTAACIMAVSRTLSFDLDFTQDTLPILDHYLSQIDPEDEEARGIAAPMAGAYFGELIRRTVAPSRWHTPEGEYERWRLECERVMLSFNPIGVALEAIVGQSVEGSGAHLDVPPASRDVAHTALALYEDARADDYFRLTLRFEAIEQLHIALDKARRAGGENGAVGPYGDEDYAPRRP